MTRKLGKIRKLHFAGYTFTVAPDGKTSVDRQHIDLTQAGDFGADPLSDGTFRMVPSGRIVDAEEKRRILQERK